MSEPRQPYFILSPTGTSILTNQAGDQRRLIGQYANAKTFEAIQASSEEDSLALQNIVNKATAAINNADLEQASRLSAELNGIIKFYQGQFDRAPDYHVLLCTDTWLGSKTAEIAAGWLQAQALTVEVKRQTDLQTADLSAFQLALSEMVEWCQEVIEGYRDNNYRVIFNLTGGFKSVQGFLQTLATFYADETIYIFETATDLLRIPKLPVVMAAEETVRENLTTFRRLALNLTVDEPTGLPETLTMTIDGKLALSPWGDIIWQQTRNILYEQQVHAAPSSKIQFGPQFDKTVESLPGDRLRQINRRLDDLARYLETGQHLSSLDCKELKGSPSPPSTHEIDAWADKDAKRIFGHYQDGVFVLDRLTKKLQ